MMIMSLLAATASAQDAAVLWDRFQTHFAEDGSPLVVDDHDPGCLTGLVAELREGLPLMDASQQQAILQVIEPWRQSDDAIAPPASCIGRYGESYVEGEHFSVEWDGSTINETQASNFLEALETSWEVEIDEMGWYGPTGATSYPILVYVQSGGYAGAYTSVTGCSEGSYGSMPYIVAYAGSFSAGNWYKTMAAHEFNHASQFYYGYAHEFYWWESTATWMEENVFPTQNDWADPIYYGYSLQPHIAMNASDQSDNDIFWHMYGMGIWGKYLDEHVGGPDLVLSLWEEALSSQGMLYRLWMPDVIEDLGYDFDELYEGFMAVAAVMDFEEAAYYNQPELRATVNELPSAGDAPGSTAPQSLGQNFIKFSGSLAAENSVLEVSFDGQDGVEWYAVLAKGEENALSEYVAFDIDADGVGIAQIDFSDGEDVYLVLSPKDDDAVGSYVDYGGYDWARAEDFSYEWSAELVDLTPVEETPEAGGSGEEGAAACGCSASTGALSLGWLVGLVGLMRRREG